MKRTKVRKKRRDFRLCSKNKLLFIATAEDQLQFIPGIVVRHGKFICGQFITEADGLIHFVRGQVVATSQGPKFVHGQTISTPDGIKFVAG